MMTLSHDLQYYRDANLKFSAVELPYNVNIGLKFVFVIFKKNVQLTFILFSTIILK